MKIIQYIPSISRTSGGTTTYLQLLAKELGKQTELYIVSHKSNDSVTIENSHIHYIAPLKNFQDMQQQWFSLLHELKPDIVHVNCCWMPQCALVQRWSQNAGYKVILTPHGMLEPWIMRRHYWTKKKPALLLYQKQAIIKADYLHATAESEKKNLLKLGYNTKVEVIANGVDLDLIKQKQSWKKSKQILFLSRIHVKKGIEFLLEAVAFLKQELRDYTIIIAGEGDPGYINQLKNKAQTLEIEQLIHFCGGVYEDEKWKLFQQVDLFILPTYSENFGMVVAESLASGTPVITTQGTPWKELNTKHCGWWIETNRNAIITTLKEFLSIGETELEIMGKNGRRLIEEKYTARKMAIDMIKLYQKICN